jgi:hypothetical protein
MVEEIAPGSVLAIQATEAIEANASSVDRVVEAAALVAQSRRKRPGGSHTARRGRRAATTR